MGILTRMHSYKKHKNIVHSIIKNINKHYNRVLKKLKLEQPVVERIKINFLYSMEHSCKHISHKFNNVIETTATCMSANM